MQTIKPGSAGAIIAALFIGLGLSVPTAALARKKAAAQPAVEAPAEQPAAVEAPVDTGPRDPVEQFKLGVKANGAGNFPEALSWFEKSAAQGFRGAELKLGQMYDQGRGVARNPGEAVKWYLKAAKQGDAQAQYNLAQLYTQAGNHKEAIYWLSQAANLGSNPAQFDLAMHYEAGTAVKKSLPEAYKYLVLAASDGAPTHTVNRERVAKLLTPPEVEAIEKMLAEWEQAKAAKTGGR